MNETADARSTFFAGLLCGLVSGATVGFFLAWVAFG